jgi:hypothetical protein
VTASSSSSVLAGLRAVPGGFGQPTFASLLAAILADAHAQAANSASPPTLLVIGEPLAGKSTFLSGLIADLQDLTPVPAPTSRGAGGGVIGRREVTPYLIRWGDTIRGAKQRGVVAQERQFGDLTPEEFAGVSRLLAEAAQAAAAHAARQAKRPALVVVEAPGLTMLTDPAGRPRGLDRGYTLARRLAADPHGYFVALCADQQVRETGLGGRQERITVGGPEIREATHLAANRIRQQVTDLLYDLAVSGTIHLPQPLPEPALTREMLDRHSAYRNQAVLTAYLPYLFRDDLHVPPDRAFIGLNAFLDDAIRPDLQLLDAHDWTHRHFGI